MSEVLSAAWFDEMNGRLAAATPPVPSPSGGIRVVFEFSDEPAGSPHAMTFSVQDGRASLEPGDHLGAHVIVHLSYEDGRALADGSLRAGQALREGRLKVRGDTDALNQFGAWIVAAQAASTESP